jgi:ribose 1,5-bisphosphate isomerase
MVLTDTADKIKSMEIRGAGRIARAAALALAEHADSLNTTEITVFFDEMKRAADLMAGTRPTAVSLPNAVNIVMASIAHVTTVPEAKRAIGSKAREFVQSSNQAVERIGKIGARHIRDGDVVLTHCNSEAALACLIEAKRSGKDFSVFATEVRPRNQGLLTIRVLNDAGITTNFIVDSAVRSFMNEIDLVITGADAVTVNGAVVNKIGTAQIALAAHEARTNFVVAAETYKFAPRTILGELIEIEERPAGEVLPDEIAKSLPYVTVRNPVFDVTPAEYVDLIITESGAIPPQMAYIIIRDYLGWDLSEFGKEFDIDHHD